MNTSEETTTLSERVLVLALVAAAMDVSHLSDRAREWINEQSFGPCHESRGMDVEAILAAHPACTRIAGIATGMLRHRDDTLCIDDVVIACGDEREALEHLNIVLFQRRGPIAIYPEHGLDMPALLARMLAAQVEPRFDTSRLQREVLDLAFVLCPSRPTRTMPLAIAAEVLDLTVGRPVLSIRDATAAYRAEDRAALAAELISRLQETAALHAHLLSGTQRRLEPISFTSTALL